MMLHTESENQDLIGACLYGEWEEELEHGAPTGACSESTAVLQITKTQKWSTEKYDSCEDGVQCTIASFLCKVYKQGSIAYQYNVQLVR